MSNASQIQHNLLSYQSERKTSNIFPEISSESFYHHHSKKSPKVSRKVGKCLQFMIICQKLIQPFTSSSKVVKSEDVKKYYMINKNTKPILELSHSNRSSITTTAAPITKVNAYVQTSDGSLEDITEMIYEDGYGTNLGSKEFPSDVDSLVKEPYWELDIDSAIVGDYNHTSTVSLTEQIDPLYTAIKTTTDGRFIEKCQSDRDRSLYGCIYPEEKRSCSSSNASSPKSGVYMKIMKPKKSEEYTSQKMGFLKPISNSRLNFEQIMMIRSRMGLTYDSRFTSKIGMDYSNLRMDTISQDIPDIPSRSYGSSVINFITELRQHDSYNRSYQNFSINSISPSVENLDTKTSKCHIYSPIWSTKVRPSTLSSHISETPLSEPMVPKKSINRMLHPLTNTYPNEVSDNMSSISINDPSKLKYCYPPNFSDSNQHSRLTDEINQFRHMDSELDLDLSLLSKDKMAALIREKWLNDLKEVNVPLKERTDNVHVLSDDKIILQPLMERSCEDDYFRSDILSSLDFINV